MAWLDAQHAAQLIRRLDQLTGTGTQTPEEAAWRQMRQTSSTQRLSLHTEKRVPLPFGPSLVDGMHHPSLWQDGRVQQAHEALAHGKVALVHPRGVPGAIHLDPACTSGEEGAAVREEGRPRAPTWRSGGRWP